MPNLVVRIPSSALFAQNTLISSTTPQYVLNQENVRLAAQVPIDDDLYHAVALDPSTGYRHAYLFLDDGETPYPLIGGEILRARFRRLRVAPFLQATWTTETVDPGLSVFTSIPFLNNQTLALRVFREPPAQTHLALPDTMQFVQSLLVVVGAGTALTPTLYHIHAPGARGITFFAGNNGNANSAVYTLSILGVQAEQAKELPLSTSVGSWILDPSPVVAPKLIVPAAATAAPVTLTLVDPGTSEYIIWGGNWGGINAGIPGGTTFHVGCVVNYHAA